MEYRLALIRNRKNRNGRVFLDYKICVVTSSSGSKVLAKLGNYSVFPVAGHKYLYINKMLLGVWVSRGLLISPRLWRMLKGFN